MIKEIKNWCISINSFANVGALSNEQINDMFTCYNNKHYQKCLVGFSKNDSEYVDYPTALWQLEKSREVEKSFHNNIEHFSDGDIVRCYVNLEIMFPESFNRDNVIEWVDGFHRLSKVHLLNQSDEYANTIRNKLENKFLEELMVNEKWIVDGGFE